MAKWAAARRLRGHLAAVSPRPKASSPGVVPAPLGRSRPERAISSHSFGKAPERASEGSLWWSIQLSMAMSGPPWWHGNRKLLLSRIQFSGVPNADNGEKEWPIDVLVEVEDDRHVIHVIGESCARRVTLTCARERFRRAGEPTWPMGQASLLKVSLGGDETPANGSHPPVGAQSEASASQTPMRRLFLCTDY